MGFEILINYGKLYGYPDCCIEYFHKNFNNYSEDQKKVSEGNGFIPCPFHTSMILQGTIKISDLIQNRKAPRPYPCGKLKP